MVGFNKRLLYAAVGAPGSTHDNRLLKESSIYRAILDGDIMPEKVIRLGDLLPLVTAPSLNMHGHLKCITRIHGINSNVFQQKAMWSKDGYGECV